MSGTSLDGVDFAYCEFRHGDTWSFDLLESETIPYPAEWTDLLQNIHKGAADEISKADCMYGEYLGLLSKDFCEKHNIRPDFISSHGHTIFHQPAKKFTKQIGSGAYICAAAGVDVICDFRTLDVALGGQGAPLVPAGDKFLFSRFDFCLNLGGIANISFTKNNSLIAFDICACNLVLNYFASLKNMSYDKDGKLAEKGSVNFSLLKELEALPYYRGMFPKSLGREDIERDILPLLIRSGLDAEDILSTFCEHIADRISLITGQEKNKRMIITGGGALNNYLVDGIKNKSSVEVFLPEKKIIEFKEAIIFGFLGVLRKREEVNCFMSVTGATADNCGGSIYSVLKKIS